MRSKILSIIEEEFSKVEREAEAVGHRPDHLDLPRLKEGLTGRLLTEVFKPSEIRSASPGFSCPAHPHDPRNANRRR